MNPVQKLVNLETTIIKGSRNAESGQYWLMVFSITIVVWWILSAFVVLPLFVEIVFICLIMWSSYCICDRFFGCFTHMFEISRLANWVDREMLVKPLQRKQNV
jgi:hypothetical protein